MPPKSTLWRLEPHTRGKHLVLHNYMQAWLPILSTWNKRLVFIDAFAGPGEYEGGELGSPVIALRALINHNAQQRMKGDFFYLFIEKDKKRCDHLSMVLNKMKQDLPSNCSYQVVNSTFDDTLTSALDKLDEQKKTLAPSFVMIDPFGVSDTPMQTVARILSNPNAEVYISFMYDFINRFNRTDGFESHLDSLFGCEDWRRGQCINDVDQRKQFYFELYERQLKGAGAKYVLRFELYEGGRLVYAIFFGTQDLKGCDKMKQAIWKEAPFGDYKFKGDLIGQLSLGDSMTDLTRFRQDLLDEFGTSEWVRVEEITDFAMSDRTGFHTGHLKNKTLAPMEREGTIEVDRSSNKSSKGYPDGTKIRFKCIQSPPEQTSPKAHQAQLL